jgi:hypothetical protein
MPTDRRHILGEIRRTAQANGGVPLGVRKFSQETGIKITDWDGKFWLRWGNALREAGFEPTSTFRVKRPFGVLGSKQQLAKKIRDYCEKHAGYEDVAALCASVAAPLGEPQSEGNALATDTAASTKEGYVYMGLLKLGREKRYELERPFS